jgi:hypothetical protein
MANVAVVELRRLGSRFANELSDKWSGRSTSQENELRTRSELGVLIPEIFPENDGGLVPNVGIDDLFFRKSQPDVPKYGNHTLDDTLTIQHGRHTAKAGMQVGFEEVDWNAPGDYTQGSYLFRAGGAFTGFQNFLRGNADGACGRGCFYGESESDIKSRLRFRTRRSCRTRGGFTRGSLWIWG